MFANLSRQNPCIFEWRSTDGQNHRALLTLPKLMNANKLPALVILPQGSHAPNVFRPDGAPFSTFAQQLLVSRGFAVLQIELSADVMRAGETMDDFSQVEFKRAADLLDSAIQELIDRQLVDSERLGIYGFSHTGAIARALLLSPGRFKFRAAAQNDSFATTLTSFFAEVAKWGGVRDGTTDAEKYYGGNFWTQRNRWLEQAPDLNSHKATGPFLYVIHGITGDALYVVPEYAAFSGSFNSSHRPIELVNFPDGGHVLNRPRQRAVSLNLNVDWMDFWLQNNERKEPDIDSGETSEILEDQYARWRQMKADWQRQQAWEAAGNLAGSTPDPHFQIPDAQPTSATQH